MVDQVANFITKYQVKRVAILLFMMWLTRDVYSWVMLMIETKQITSDLMAAAVLGPHAALFAGVLKYMQEEQ